MRGASGLVAPFGAGAPAEARLTGLSPATADAVITVAIRGDLGAVNEFVTVKVNGTSVGNLFVAGGSDCPATPDRATLTIPVATWNGLVTDSTAVVTLGASATVNAAECSTSARINVRVLTAAGDCNTNGTSDLCEIASGTQADCDRDRRPDACTVVGGTVADCNANGSPDACDIAGLPSLDCDLDGVIDSCAVSAGTSPDCNANGVPDGCDLAGGGLDCNANGVIDS